MAERLHTDDFSEFDDLDLPPNSVREMLRRYSPNHDGWIVESAEGSYTPFSASRSEMDELKRALSRIVDQWEKEGFDPTAEL